LTYRQTHQLLVTDIATQSTVYRQTVTTVIGN